MIEMVVQYFCFAYCLSLLLPDYHELNGLNDSCWKWNVLKKDNKYNTSQ